MDAAASEGMRLLALAVRRSDAATTPPPRRRSASNSASTTRCRQWPAPRSRPSTTRRRCAAPTSAWPWAGRVPRLPRKPPKWCSFASIAHAVEEGRTVYGNLKKALIFILPTNGAQAGMILIAIVLGLTLPITPVQILWVNMVTAVTLALAIAFERPEPNVMREPPRNPAEPLLTRFMLWRIVFVTVFLVAGSLGLFLWELERGMPVEVARTAAINALVMGEIFYLFNCRRLTRPAIGWSGFVGNRAVLFAIGVLVVLQALFNTAPLDALTWLKILAFGVIVYSVVEIEKALVRRRASPSH
jgi:magnesium-transporting ATPase (P-type)